MALPSSGQIKISQIRTELGSTSGSLRTLSSLAGKSTPDSMSELYYPSGLVMSLDASKSDSYSGTGTTWTDTTSGYNATLTNGPVYTTEYGGGFIFDGSNDYAVVNNSMASALQDKITIIVWAKVPNFNLRVPIFGKYQTTAPYGYVLEVGTLGGLWNRSMRFYAQGDNSVDYSADYRGTAQLADNTIYMFTATYDPASSIIKMYYNLTEMTASNVNPFWAAVINFTEGTNLNYVGSYGPVTGIYGNSRIYSTYVFNKALTFSEVTQMYNLTKGRFGL